MCSEGTVAQYDWNTMFIYGPNKKENQKLSIQLFYLLYDKLGLSLEAINSSFGEQSKFLESWQSTVVLLKFAGVLFLEHLQILKLKSADSGPTQVRSRGFSEAYEDSELHSSGFPKETECCVFWLKWQFWGPQRLQAVTRNVCWSQKTLWTQLECSSGQVQRVLMGPPGGNRHLQIMKPIDVKPMDNVGPPIVSFIYLFIYGGPGCSFFRLQFNVYFPGSYWIHTILLNTIRCAFHYY